jgi:hypothetical protein
MRTIDYLLENSNLPGPRGNLELMYEFARDADDASVRACLGYIKDDTANSPEEFVGMCGLVGYATLNREKTADVLAFLKPYASHASWRIREAVAMGIQEISVGRLAETLGALASWVDGNPYERRAVVAGLCEPKLLGDVNLTSRVLAILETITRGFDHGEKLADGDDSLRKALGYGWSVAIVHAPEAGKKAFEKLFALPGKHVKWIMKENLKKNRLVKMDAGWVSSCAARLG